MLYDAVVQFVASEFDPIPLGDGEAPTLEGVGDQGTTKIAYRDALKVGYIVANEVDVGDPTVYAGYSGGQGMEWVRVQFSCIGSHAQQVRRLGEAIANSLTERSEADSSVFVNDITVPGHAILVRRKGPKIPLDTEGVGVQGGRTVDFLVQATA